LFAARTGATEGRGRLAVGNRPDLAGMMSLITALVNGCPECLVTFSLDLGGAWQPKDSDASCETPLIPAGSQGPCAPRARLTLFLQGCYLAAAGRSGRGCGPRWDRDRWKPIGRNKRDGIGRWDEL
jgi:hypothetical protein